MVLFSPPLVLVSFYYMSQFALKSIFDIAGITGIILYHLLQNNQPSYLDGLLNQHYQIYLPGKAWLTVHITCV